MKATNKNPAIDALLTNLSGRDRIASVSGNTCAWCRGPADNFRDELSIREYLISGLCQNCQDKIFGTED
jgi:hypothetical protein